MLVFLEGGTFFSARRVRTALMAAMTRSISASSAGNSRVLSATGQGETISASPSWGRACQISSVMKGIKGWRSLRVSVSTQRSTRWALRLLSSSPLWRRDLVSSIYQSQKLSQMKS